MFLPFLQCMSGSAESGPVRLVQSHALRDCRDRANPAPAAIMIRAGPRRGSALIIMSSTGADVGAGRHRLISSAWAQKSYCVRK